MKIAIIGTRGIPNHYGGFEQFVQFFSVMMAARGHEVTVYNSSLHPYKENSYQGVRIVHVRDWEDRLGVFGQFLFDYNAIKHARRQRYEITLQLGYTSSSVWMWLFDKKTKVITNMDGLEWKRSKYSRPVQHFLRQAEKWAAVYSHDLVADNSGVQEHLWMTYKRKATLIEYGAEPVRDTDPAVLQYYKLLPGAYYLVIARMEPENNIDMIIEGYLESGKQEPLVLVGALNTRYAALLLSRYGKHPELRFLDAVFDKSILDSLRSFSRMYFHGHSVGGTNPSLLEAMAAGCAVCAHDNVFNYTILDGTAYYFGSAADITTRIIAGPGPEADSWKEQNKERVRQYYNWELIVSRYESLFLKTIADI